ncbi:DUF1702 family protein [Actinoallomurus sp. NPDC050550]|uniref:DUF1702 family protein n=1 Tax=Actinoallomurus sp. NPDC050550 TaxID=3154937 RepID=UPI0033E30958
MPTLLGSLRRVALTPSLAEVGFAHRGFPVAASEVTRHLEAIPQSVICGFEWGIDTRDQREVEHRVGLVREDLRGFAYEGVTMAFTVLDAMGPRRGRRTRDLLLGPGRSHIFLAYIGIGFAMARLPRPLWKKVLPDLGDIPYHPTMSWLAVDGYGFDRAYFDTDRFVGRQERPRPYPWLGMPEYFHRAADQGIGRALWFIHAADVPAVAAAVERFDVSRRPDLWSGVGLAATFAGGAGRAALADLKERAGQYRPELAQGAVFAAKARDYSGAVPEYSRTTLDALAGMSIETAAKLADATEVEAGTTVPAYELWRLRVRDHFDVTPSR